MEGLATTRLSPKLDIESLQALISEDDVQALNRDGSLVDPQAVTRGFLIITKKETLPRIRRHDVRHPCVVAALKAGVDVKTISQRIGLADVNVTLTAFHEDDKQASNATAALLYLHDQRNDRLSINYSLTSREQSSIISR
jgi:hypothetical protein